MIRLRTEACRPACSLTPVQQDSFAEGQSLTVQMGARAVSMALKLNMLCSRAILL